MTAVAILFSALAMTSGVSGVEKRSPVTPVCKVATPCSAPAKHVELRFLRRGVTVATRTDDQGRYFVRLRPGTWIVRIPSAQFGFDPKTTVVVRLGQITRRSFVLDTGIR